MEQTEKIEKTSKETSIKEEPNVPGGVRVLKKSASWQRVTISLAGILIEIVIWQIATWHLYSLPSTSVSSFTTITVNCFYVIGAMVVFFVTGKVIYDMKVDTVSHVITEGRNLLERREEKIDVTENPIAREMEQEFSGDPSYRPLDTLQDKKTEVFR